MQTCCRIILGFALVWLAFNSSARPPLQTDSEYLVQTWQTDDGLAQNWVSSIAQGPDGYLWIGTRYGGLARFDGLRFVHFTPQNTPELKDCQLERLAMDSQGTLWIAMGNRSVTALRHGRFELFRLPRTDPQSRLESALVNIGEKTLFTAESGEIAELDSVKGTNGWRILQPTPAARAFQYNVYPAETFLRDRDGNLWYITREQHLARYTDEVSRNPPDALTFPDARVQALAIDSQGMLWIATANQIVSWDGHQVEDHTPPGTGGLSDVRQIAFSGDGGLWVYEPQRLRKLSHGKWVASADAELLKTSVTSRHFQLYGDSTGGAWIASYGHGLLHARADGTTHRLTEKDGLPSELITAWFEDREGNIWIGTAGQGLARIRERIFHRLGISDGLPEKVVRSVAVDPQGGVWMGTMSGQLARWSGGKSTVLPLPPVEASPIGDITVWPSSNGAVWIGGVYHGLMRFENGEVTHPVSSGDPWLIRVFFEDSQGVLWVGGRGALRRYESGNLKTYGPREGFESGVAIGAITEAPSGALWIGTESGELWRLKENQFSCFRMPANWPSSQILSLRADTNGISLWLGSNCGIIRASKEELNEIADGKITWLHAMSYGEKDGFPKR